MAIPRIAASETTVDAERRQSYRVITRIVPRYAARVDETLEEPEHLDAVILDISGGGALIQSRQMVPFGAHLRLRFALEGDPLELDVAAVVTQVRATPIMAGRVVYIPHYRIHCAFRDVTRRDTERIVRYVYRQQLLLRRRGAL